MEKAQKLLKCVDGVFTLSSAILEESKGNETPKRVTSIIGVQSDGKSTFMNSLIGEPNFYVNPDEAEALETTTQGIDLCVKGDQVYLDTEGCSSKEEGKTNERGIKLFTFAVNTSSNIILLVRDNYHSIKGGFFTTF